MTGRPRDPQPRRLPPRRQRDRAPDAPPLNRPRPAAPPKPPVHVPEAEGLLIVIERAAMLVFDFFDFVPVTVRQSPAATALTD